MWSRSKQCQNYQVGLCSLCFLSFAENYSEANWWEIIYCSCGPACSMLTLGLFWVLEVTIPGYLLQATGLPFCTWYLYTNSDYFTNLAQPLSFHQQCFISVFFSVYLWEQIDRITKISLVWLRCCLRVEPDGQGFSVCWLFRDFLWDST